MNDTLKGILIGTALGIVLMIEYQKMTKPKKFWHKVLAVFK